MTKVSNRACLREPIPEIIDAARLLDAAVSAHLLGRRELADTLFRLANNEVIWHWIDSVIGKNSSHVQYRKMEAAPPFIPSQQRITKRMPNSEVIKKIHLRDGFHCRFCGMPVIKATVRRSICSAYPEAVPWGKTNASRHRAFFAMWAQYDHILPHARGGTNSIDNMVLACAACQFGRMNYTLDEVGLQYPRQQTRKQQFWDGLERFAVK
jgi:hypothetical protein